MEGFGAAISPSGKARRRVEAYLFVGGKRFSTYLQSPRDDRMIMHEQAICSAVPAGLKTDTIPTQQ